MIKFFYSKYELTPLTAIGALAEAINRHGALIKAVWPNGMVGYADLFPWVELGDENLDKQLEALAEQRLTAIGEQTLWMAKRDAQWREKKINAHVGTAKVKNHYLLNDYAKASEVLLREIRGSPFTTIKLKVGRNLEEEALFVAKLIKQLPFAIRLDFNAKCTYPEYEKFMMSLSSGERARIEYVEDPMPWNLENWKKASGFAPLALDAEYDKVDWKVKETPFRYLIIKPARQDVDKAVMRADQRALKMSVTSAMDHPVGIAHASIVAAEIKKTYPNMLVDCGLLTMRAYKANDFANKMIVQGPFISSINGYGIGFDELLNEQKWTPISSVQK